METAKPQFCLQGFLALTAVGNRVAAGVTSVTWGENCGGES